MKAGKRGCEKAAGVVAGGTEAGEEVTLPEPGAAGRGEPSAPLKHIRIFCRHFRAGWSYADVVERNTSVLAQVNIFTL